MASLECTVCSESFKAPRILPCGHTFCQECLQGWLKTSQKLQDPTIPAEQRPSCELKGQDCQRQPTPNTLSCPECREDHPVPDIGVEGFQKNFVLSRASEEEADLPKCDNCISGNQAVARCLDCYGGLCEKCLELHQKVEFLRKNHSILPLGTEGAAGDVVKKPTFIPKYKPCSLHDNKPIEYYCTKCNVACCQSGSLTTHKLHECITLDEKATEISQEMADLLETYADEDFKIDELEESWVRIKNLKESNTKEVNAFIAGWKKCVIESVERLAEKLQNEVGEDLSEFSEIFRGAKKKLDALKQQRSKIKSDVEDVIKKGNLQEIYSLAQEMKQKLQSADTSETLPRPVSRRFITPKQSGSPSEIDTAVSETFQMDKIDCSEKPVPWKSINCKTAEDRKTCSLYDVALSDSGRIAVTDAGNAKVKVFSREGSLLHESKYQFRNPSYISALPGDEEHFLVTDVAHKVLKWSMWEDDAEDFITSGGSALTDPRGISITRSDDQDRILIANDGNPRTIVHVDSDGRVLRTDPLNTGPWLIAGHPCHQHVVFTCYGTLTAADSGGEIWQADRGRLGDPRGVVLMQSGQVLVADIDQGTVVLVSREGQVLKTLLSAEDGLKEPWGLAYNERLGLLAVTELSGLVKLFLYYNA